MPAIEPVLVSVDAARAMLGGIGKTNLYAMLSAGDLESVKLGKRRLIRVSSIQALADRAVAA
ncbi:helix-turn-helix domain-containing protein [Sphingomonas sp.]|uniref:helix-turn-helix domain-containing protein n=1 Tax=Sphingomonas sp. TaxID=28214 RepID=UPI0035C7A7C1